MVEKSEIKKEIDFALSCIAIGCNKLYKEEQIEFKKIEDKIQGLASIQKGAHTLNMVSEVSNFNSKKEKFPVDLKTVLDLIENYTIDEWVKKYSFLKDYVKDLAEISFNFLDDVDLGEHERVFKENSEYELYIKYNNDIGFLFIRQMSTNDNEYAFSRVGIDTVLEGNALNINTFLKAKFKKYFGDDNISEKFIETILNKYYKDIVNLNKYYHCEEGYAYCKHCGSLIQKISRKDTKYLCSFDVCMDRHKKFNIQTEIGGYIKNPTKVLKYEVLRFVSYPSIEEWSMYNKLKVYEKNGIISDLILYYNKDACDISFVCLGIRYALDLKEWVNPYDLAKRISEENFKRNNKDAKCFIVIPDYLTKKSNGRDSMYIDVLKSSVNTKAIKEDEILTVSQFLKQLKNLTSKAKKEKKNETKLHI